MNGPVDDSRVKVPGMQTIRVLGEVEGNAIRDLPPPTPGMTEAETHRLHEILLYDRRLARLRLIQRAKLLGAVGTFPSFSLRMPPTKSSRPNLERCRRAQVCFIPRWANSGELGPFQADFFLPLAF